MRRPLWKERPEASQEEQAARERPAPVDDWHPFGVGAATSPAPSTVTQTRRCFDCGAEFTTAERFGTLCPRCDAKDEAAHRKAYATPIVRRDAWMENRRNRRS